LLATELRHFKLDQITAGNVATVAFPGSGSNANTAIRTLRRILNRAVEEGKLTQVSKLRNRAEVKRKLCSDDVTEALIFPHLEHNTRDALTIMRDVGARNSEVLAIRWEFVNWTERTFCNPEGKTDAAARVWLLSDRVMEILSARHVRRKRHGLDGYFRARRASPVISCISTTRASARLARSSDSLLNLFHTQHDTILGHRA